MLRVKTRLGLSHVDGVGLFADQFIPKGTVTWGYDPEFDFRISEEQINSLPEWTREQILKYSYFDYAQDCYVLCVDDQRFINHSIYPNIESTPSEDRAACDIQPGEELFCNYEQYEKNWFERRGVKQADFIYIIKAE